MVQTTTDEAVLTRARGEVCRGGAAPSGARLELAALKSALKVTQREVRRITWRRAMQARTTLIARVLRAACAALRVPGGRARAPMGWEVYAGTADGASMPVLRVLTRTAPRTLVDLAKPIAVVVERDDLVDVDALLELGAAITFTQPGAK